jgi:Cell division septal protein
LFEVEEIDNQVTEEAEAETSEEESEHRISFMERLPKIQAYRNKQLYQRLGLLILLFLIPLLVTVYYISPLNALEKLTVTGNKNVATDVIIKDSKLTINDNLWHQYFNRELAAEEIKKQSPRIKKVNITLNHLNQLNIAVTEYSEVAILVKGKSYFPILENGVIVEEGKSEPDANKLIFENFSDKEQILATLKAYQSLSPEIQERVSQVKYAPSKNNDQLLNVYMNDGNQVIVNISNMASQMKYYPQVVKEMDEKGIIDMEVGIFSYPYPDTKETSESAEQTE